MELTKNRITTTNLKAAKYVEFTVDDDFNVPDVKGDIDRQIASKGQVTIENIDVMEGKARITGTVSYAILYQTEPGRGIHLRAMTENCHLRRR